MIKIFNTLTNQKETFHPLNEGQVKMYVCGPTVYNYIHIGNARSAVAFDTVRRYLEYKGFDVTYVSNFTDVDDKIIRRANEEGLTHTEIADKYIDAYYEDTDALGIERATVNPRVVDNMTEIIDFVSALVDNGFAYISGGDVYYRAHKFEHYGELSDQSLTELRANAGQRLGANASDTKEDPADFALWKAAKSGEPAWESPWGEGRPGWHIECSVMSTKYLGDTIDIHGGGYDLTFPHHENEIAQSEAKTGQKFVNYWMHNGFVTMGEDNEKMSKSLGNFVLVHELLKEESPRVLRFFLSSAHYRAPLKFSDSNLADAANNVKRLDNTYRAITYRLESASDALADDNVMLKPLETITADFEAAMDDDFNVPNGLTVFYQLVSLINHYLDRDDVSKVVLDAYLDLFETLAAIFGLTFDAETALDQHVQEQIQKREEARKNRDFETADQIRDQLKAEGIILDDTPQGTRWKRVD